MPACDGVPTLTTRAAEPSQARLSRDAARSDTAIAGERKTRGRYDRRTGGNSGTGPHGDARSPVFWLGPWWVAPLRRCRRLARERVGAKHGLSHADPGDLGAGGGGGALARRHPQPAQGEFRGVRDGSDGCQCHRSVRRSRSAVAQPRLGRRCRRAFWSASDSRFRWPGRPHLGLFCFAAYCSLLALGTAV